MGKTKIEWADYTFNPWIGCSKVSAGCKHCYAETLMDTRYGRVEWGEHGTRVRTSPGNWKKPISWDKQVESTGLKRVFCASLADVFEDRPELEQWRTDLFGLIQQTPNLIWMLLTKRPENVLNMGFNQEALPNVWIGTSVENQETANERIPHLLKVPAAVRFLSCEPLLGPVDLKTVQYDNIVEIDSLTGDHGVIKPYRGRSGNKINWVIVGGESGSNARPMHPDWVRSLRNQCVESGVPFFFKQNGAYRPASNDDPLYKQQHKFMFSEFATVPMVKISKKEDDRLLDGREWNEFPGESQ